MNALFKKGNWVFLVRKLIWMSYLRKKILGYMLVVIIYNQKRVRVGIPLILIFFSMGSCISLNQDLKVISEKNPASLRSSSMNEKNSLELSFNRSALYINDLFSNVSLLLPNGTMYFSDITNETVAAIWKIVQPNYQAQITIEVTDLNVSGNLLLNCEYYIAKEKSSTIFNVTDPIKVKNNQSRSIRSNFTNTDQAADWYFVLHPGANYGNYSIVAVEKDQGFSFPTAKSLTSNTAGSFPFVGTWEYWYLTLESNQRISITITAQNKEVIDGLRVDWHDSPESTEHDDKATDLNEPSWTTQFKSSKPLTHRYYLLLKHAFYSDTAITGSYNLSIELEESGYNFDKAYTLVAVNGSWNEYFDYDYPGANPYFKFSVDSRVRVEITVSGENDTNLLEYAQVEVYRPDKSQIASFKEEDGNDNQIQGTFLIDEDAAGDYYFKLELFPLNSGLVNISLNISESPKSFEWKFEAQIITLFFFGLAILLLGFQRKRWSFIQNQWTVSAPIDIVYKALFDSQRFEIYGMIPDKLLKIKRTILGMKYSSELTLEQITPKDTILISSRKAQWWESIVPILAVVSSYFLINYLILLSSPEKRLLPISLDSTENILILGSLLFTILTGLLLISLLLREQHKNFEKEVEGTIHDLVRSHKDISIPEAEREAFFEKQIERNISYVRVLWNQAKTAFKEDNYDLFVIKADAGVKKLLETRYMQVYGYLEFDSSMDFKTLCEKIRLAGFDIPKVKKIEHHRKLRNYIVHSSRILDQDESAEVFSYYNKFLGRLGLRA